MKPMIAAGLSSLIMPAVLQSDLKDGVEVWMTISS